jgi:hypothetical protein
MEFNEPSSYLFSAQLLFLHPSSLHHIYEFAESVKSTFPALTSAPPIHVLVNGVSPHTALAALTHPSHRPFVMSIVCPEVAAVNTNLAVPEAPVVVVGLPAHCSIVPAMLPQMESRATLISWSTRVLLGKSENGKLEEMLKTLR